MGFLAALLFEYETPKVVRVRNIPMGSLRLVLQIIGIVHVLSQLINRVFNWALNWVLKGMSFFVTAFFNGVTVFHC